MKEDKGEARIQALGALLNLAAADDNQILMATSADLGLLLVLAEVVREDKGEARVNALWALQNLACAAETKY